MPAVEAADSGKKFKYCVWGGQCRCE